MTRVAALFALLAAIAVMPTSSIGQVDQASYANLEGAQTSPIRLSPSGLRLFAVNTADARLSVFDLANPSAPRLIAEIPVGIEPVSVNPRTEDEAWVVNQASDSVSVVSVSKGIVTDTILVKDEPADVVFVDDLAFVSVARSSQVRVFNALTHALVKSISLLGSSPRALASNASTGKVYAAFALGGNRTTIIPFTTAPPQPPPSNPELPPPPRVSLIVDARDPRWSWLINYTMPDTDVVEIDARALAVTRYFSDVGTTNFGLAVEPVSGDIYVANTEARNLVRFEPNLRGHWMDNRITRIQVGDTTTAYDLNPTIDYSVLPNPAAQAIALAQPTAIVFEPLGRFMFVAAFGTDRIGVVDTTGNVLARIDVGPPGVDPRKKRGPRGLALHAPANRLYVLNRISNTISIVDVDANSVIGEIPVGRFDPTPTAVRTGRGFLYDAKLSGNGTGSCASCHIDADMDHLAWDLGDPGGTMHSIVQDGQTITLHPMKGPMTTQTLRGLLNVQPYHWRGDRADFSAFNGAFDKLMGGSQLSDDDMAALTDFINSVRFMPNPNQNLDRSFPTFLNGGDAAAGMRTFAAEPIQTGVPVTCATCHSLRSGGTNRRIHFSGLQTQPFKVAHLRNLYQKVLFSRTNGVSLDGFGLDHDGMFAGPLEFLSQPAVGRFSDDPVAKANLTAFMICFDTGMAPAVGYTVTLSSASRGSLFDRSSWALLTQQALAGNIDLIAKGTIGGEVHGLLYRPGRDDYVADSVFLGPFTDDQLIARLLTGDRLTLMGVPNGSGVRMGIDRDLDGVLDAHDLVLAGGPLTSSTPRRSTAVMTPSNTGH